MGQTTSGWCKPLAGNEEVEGQLSGQETSKGESLKCRTLVYLKKERKRQGRLEGFGSLEPHGNGKGFGFTLMDLRKYLG